MISYDSFDLIVEEIIRLPKYGILTGRIVDIKDLIQNLVYRVIDFLENILQKLFKNMPDYNIKAIAGVFFAIIVVVLIAIVILTIFFFSRRKKRKKTLATAIFQELANPNANFLDFVAKSDQYLSQGKPREALRYRYIALLLHLRNKMTINVYTAKTDKQLKDEIKSNTPDIYDSFCSITEVFNAAWFGYKTVKGEEQARFLSTFDLLTGKEAAK